MSTNILLYLHPSIDPSTHQTVYPSIDLPIFLSTYLSTHLATHPFICLPIHLSIYLDLSCGSSCSLSTHLREKKNFSKIQHQQLWNYLGQCGWCWRRDYMLLKTHTHISADKHTLWCTCDSTVMKNDGVSKSFVLIMKPASDLETITCVLKLCSYFVQVEWLCLGVISTLCWTG